MANYSDLPGLIIHPIFQYVHTEYDLDKMIPILGTCRQWRYMGLSIAYRTVYQVLITKFGNIIMQKNNIDIMRTTNLGEFAKNIHITLEIGDDDENMERLLEVSNIDFAKDFPNVTELAIRNGHVETTAFSTQLAGNLIEVYSNQLKALNLYRVSLPNIIRFPANLIKLKYSINTKDKIMLPKINPLPLEELEIVNIPTIGFDHILQESLVNDGQINLNRMRKLTLKHDKYSRYSPYLSAKQGHFSTYQCPNLRCLTLNCGGYNTGAYGIIRRNASTLQALSIRFTNEGDNFPELITDNNGSYITYPNLLTLKLKFGMLPFAMNPIPYAKFPNTVVPFPNIQRLETSGDYQLGDNTLFRGNHYSLESIKVELSNIAVKFLSDHQIFAPGKYTKLENVHITMAFEYNKEFDQKCARMASYIGRYAKALRFDRYSIGGSLDTNENLGKQIALNFSNSLESIEQLDLNFMCVSFSDIFTLIKDLTNLRKLKIHRITSTGLPKDLTLAQMVDKFTPLNQKLEELTVQELKKKTERDSIRCLVRLAILCPALEDVWAGTVNFKSAWANVIKEKKFDEYRDRLDNIKL